MGITDSAPVGSQEPAFQQRSHPMHVGHGHVGRIGGGGEDRDAVAEPASLQGAVSGPPIGFHGAPRLYDVTHEAHQALGGKVRNMAETDTGLLGEVHRDADSRLAAGLTPSDVLLLAADVALVDFDSVRQLVPVRPDHGPAKLLQPCPGRPVAAQAQGALYRQSTGSGLSARHLPCGEEPLSEGATDACKECPCRDRGLSHARWTHQQPPLRAPRSPRLSAGGTHEALRPTESLKVSRARFLVRKELMEFSEFAGIIDSRAGLSI